MAYTRPSAATKRVLTAIASLALKCLFTPLLGGFGGFDPLEAIQYQPMSQKFHLRVIAVPAVYYLWWYL